MAPHRGQFCLNGRDGQIDVPLILPLKDPPHAMYLRSGSSGCAKLLRSF